MGAGFAHDLTGTAPSWAQDASSDTAGARILLAEDDPEQRRLAASGLRAAGFRVVTAESGGAEDNRNRGHHRIELELTAYPHAVETRQVDVEQDQIRALRACGLHRFGSVAELLFLSAVVFGAMISLTAVLLEEMSFRRYPRVRQLLLRAALGVIENFGYRQLTTWWRLEGRDRLRPQEAGLGVMTQKGFGPGISDQGSGIGS